MIGSTIRPASFCGCFGFKPSVGALNRGGSYDGLSQSSTGVLAASLEDAWQVAYEIAQRAGGDPGLSRAVRPGERAGGAEAAGASRSSRPPAGPRLRAGAKAAMDDASSG